MPDVLAESATVVIVGAGVARLARLLHSDTAAREFGEMISGLA